MNKVTEVKGQITLSDGSTSEFRIDEDGSWTQWNATRTRLGASVDTLAAMATALIEGDLVGQDIEDEEVGA